jgi:hypothetical protein
MYICPIRMICLSYIGAKMGKCISAVGQTKMAKFSGVDRSDQIGPQSTNVNCVQNVIKMCLKCAKELIIFYRKIQRKYPKLQNLKIML